MFDYEVKNYIKTITDKIGLYKYNLFLHYKYRKNIKHKLNSNRKWRVIVCGKNRYKKS